MPRLTEHRAGLINGALLSALFSATAFWLSESAPARALSLSPLILGIALGMLYANTLRAHLPGAWTPGLAFCTKQLLRTGIVLYGFRLTLQDVALAGAPAVIADAVIVAGTLALGTALGRLLRMDWETALLVSTGSAVCGAAAVLGAEATLRADPAKSAVAVATVVVFGTATMFLYPALWRAGLLDLSPTAAGVYTGATIHEVAHAVGAGNAIGGAAADMAVITKMIRVMMLVPVLLVFGCFVARQARGAGPRRKFEVPWFAILFLAVVAFNSLELLPQTALDAINAADTFMLTMAMAALGMETSLAKFRAAGAKPFVLASALELWLVFGGVVLVRVLMS